MACQGVLFQIFEEIKEVFEVSRECGNFLKFLEDFGESCSYFYRVAGGFQIFGRVTSTDLVVKFVVSFYFGVVC